MVSNAGLSRSTATSMDSLLRFFQSEYFKADFFYLMHYLYHDERPGIQDYLVNQLYDRTDQEVDSFLCQLVQICIARQCSGTSKTKSLPGSMAKADTAGNVRSKILEKNDSLSKFLIWKAKRSIHFALKIHWLALSIFEEKEQTLELKLAGDHLIDQIERAVVNAYSRLHNLPPAVCGSLDEHGDYGAGILPPPHRAGAQAGDGLTPAGDQRNPNIPSLLTYLRSLRKETRGNYFGLTADSPNVYSPEQLGDSIPHLEQEQKILVVNYWNTQLAFSTFLLSLTQYVEKTEDRDARLETLQQPLFLLNTWLLERRVFAATHRGVPNFESIGLHLPLHGWDTGLQLLKVHAHESKVFSTKTRAPFLLLCEFGNLDEKVKVKKEGDSDETGKDLVRQEVCDLISAPYSEGETLNQVLDRLTLAEWIAKAYKSDPDRDEADFLSDNPKDELQSMVRMPGGSYSHKSANVTQPDDLIDEDYVPDEAAVAEGVEAIVEEADFEQSPQESESKESANTNNEKETTDEVKDESPSKTSGGSGGKSKKTKAKGKPDPFDRPQQRSEAAQRARKLVWGEPWSNKVRHIRKTSVYSKLPTWCLRNIIVKSGDDVRQEVLAAQLITQFKWIFERAPGLNLYLRPIEVLITGARSGFIELVPDSISIDRLKRKYPDKTLGEIFHLAFGDRLLTAKKNFTESTAAYSLICYFLQVRDRHNANMLLTREGHIVHIDFGFMLSNSPGNIAFETSPFKLTQEFLDIMDGEQSEQYQYFCTLLVRGFLEARRHVERISTLIQMQMLNSNLPCFSGKSCSTIIQELEDRFMRGVPDDVCIEQVHQLIDSSVNNWRTRQYDNYQRITNGIL